MRGRNVKKVVEEQEVKTNDETSNEDEDKAEESGNAEVVVEETKETKKKASKIHKDLKEEEKPKKKGPTRRKKVVKEEEEADLSEDLESVQLEEIPAPASTKKPSKGRAAKKTLPDQDSTAPEPSSRIEKKGRPAKKTLLEVQESPVNSDDYFTAPEEVSNGKSDRPKRGCKKRFDNLAGFADR